MQTFCSKWYAIKSSEFYFDFEKLFGEFEFVRVF